MAQKVKLKLPDWADNRAIHILAGIEHLAYKLPWEEEWHVKVGRCSMCGKCCKKVKCPHLEKEPGNNKRWQCGKNLAMPYTCLISRPRKIKGCTVLFEKVK